PRKRRLRIPPQAARGRDRSSQTALDLEAAPAMSFVNSFTRAASGAPSATDLPTVTAEQRDLTARLLPLALATLLAAPLPLRAQTPDFAWARAASPFAGAAAQPADEAPYASLDSVGISVASDDLPLRSSIAQPRSPLEA